LAILVLLVLAALWAAVLIPPVVRARNGRISGGSLGGSSFRLDVLRPASRPSGSSGRSLIPGMPGAGPGAIPGAMSPTQRRRRDILVGLGGVAVVTFLLAVFTGVAALWIVCLLVVGLLAAYVVLLLQIKKRALGGAARGPAARTIRAVPHRSPLAPVGARPSRPRRSAPVGPHVPEAYGDYGGLSQSRRRSA
jgi:hypothetical protein